MTRLFISHSSHDATVASELRLGLLDQADYYQISLSSEHEAGPTPGSSWQAWITRRLHSCDVVVFLASSHSAASAWCSAEVAIARDLGRPIVPLRVDAWSPVNPLIDSQIQVGIVTQSIGRIHNAIIDVVGCPNVGARAPTSDGHEPYPGLAPLAEGSAGSLAGRELDVDSLLTTFARIPTGEAALVILSGPSGSGKSSLVQAGLIPRLKSAGWTVTGPLRPNELNTRRLSGPGPAGRQVVVVDQAEEMVTLESATDSPNGLPDSKQKIIDLLKHSTVILVVRDEFRGPVGQDLPRPRDHYAPYLSQNDLRAVIVEPARQNDLLVPDSLVERLVLETGSGAALPLLAYTLRELWQRRDLVTSSLLEIELERLGGVPGVLNTQAEFALAAACEGDPSRESDVLRLLSRLANPHLNPPTRSPLAAGGLTETERRWFDEFRTRGLVAYRRSRGLDQALDTMRPHGEDLVDVTHEAIFSWPLLAEAIRRERFHNLNRRDIEERAARFAEGPAAEHLLSGDLLRFARDEGLTKSTGPAGQLVRASIKKDRERRWRRSAVAGIVVLLVAAIALAFIARQESQRAQSAERDAEAAAVQAHSLRVAAEGIAALDSRRDTAYLTAVAAFEVDQNLSTVATLLEVAGSPNGPARYLSGDDAKWDKIGLVDDGHAIVIDQELQLALIDLASGQLEQLRIEGFEVAFFDTAPGRQQIALAARNSTSDWVVGLYDLSSRSLVAERVHARRLTSVALGADRLHFGDADGRVFATTLVNGALDRPVELHRHAGQIGVTAITLTHDDRWLASASRTGLIVQERVIHRWSEPIRLVESGGTRFGSEHVLFRPLADPPELFATGTDPSIRRFRLTDVSWVQDPVVSRHTGTVHSLAISNDGSTLFTGGRENEVRAWDADSTVPLGAPFRAHSDDVRTIEPVSAQVVVSGSEAELVMWDFAEHRRVERSGVIPDDWSSMRFTALVEGDGPIAAVTESGRIALTDGTEWESPYRVQRAWWHGDDLVVRTGISSQLDVSPFSIWLLSATSQPQLLYEQVKAADVGRCRIGVAYDSTLDLASRPDCGGSVLSVSLPASNIEEVALSPDESQIVLVYGSLNYEVRSTLTGELEHQGRIQSRHGSVVTGVEWVDDDTIATGHDAPGAGVNLLSISVGSTRPVGDHDDAVWWLAVDRERGRLVSGSQDSTIQQSDVATGRALGRALIGAKRQTENDPDSMIRGMRLIEEGEVLLAIHGYEIVAWELAPHRLVDLLCHRAGRVLTVGEIDRLNLTDHGTRVCE